MLENFDSTVINENDVFREEIQPVKQMDDDKSDRSFIIKIKEDTHKLN